MAEQEVRRAAAATGGLKVRRQFASCRLQAELFEAVYAALLAARLADTPAPTAGVGEADGALAAEAAA